MSGPGKPSILKPVVYKAYRLKDIASEEIFDVWARETDTGLVGWYAWFDRDSPQVTWLWGFYVVDTSKKE